MSLKMSANLFKNSLFCIQGLSFHKMSFIKHLQHFYVHSCLQHIQKPCIRHASFLISKNFIKTFPIKNVNTVEGRMLCYGRIGPTCRRTSHVQIRSFRTSANRHIGFPPLIWAVVKTVAKGGSILLGRMARKKLYRLPHHERSWYFKKIAQGFGILTIVGAVGMPIFYYTHLEKAPITDRTRFVSLTPYQFQKVIVHEAKKVKEQLEENIIPASHPAYKVVGSIVYRLAKGNQDIPQMKNKEWTIYIVKAKEINAFVLPSGDIFVCTGLLEFVNNEDQLAIILGHEMAHAVLSHAAETLSYAQLVDFVVIAVMAALWCFMPTDGIAIVTNWFFDKCVNILLHMPYSRDLEREADKVGLIFSAKACFDVREGSVFWHMMSMSSDLGGNTENQVIEFLSTHPLHEKRVEHLDFIMPEILKYREGCNCEPLKEDPRIYAKQVRAEVDNHITAVKARRNLSQVSTVYQSQKPILNTVPKPPVNKIQKQPVDTNQKT